MSCTLEDLVLIAAHRADQVVSFLTSAQGSPPLATSATS